MAKILPEDWHHIDTYRVDANRDGKDEWIVMYRFDLLNEGGESNGPIAAIVYQPDDNKPPNIIGHKLLAQDRDFLCECRCTPSMQDVLSGLEGNELVVSDYCGDRTARLTVFHWDEKEQKYIAKGHFCGHHIAAEKNIVKVEQPLPGRAQFMVRESYRPCDNYTTYRTDIQGTPEICIEKELHFLHGEPEDVTRSPYPEKVVLGFYHHFAEEDAPTYFTEEGWARVGQCSANQCGCYSARGEITKVRVTELWPKDEYHSQNKDIGPDRAIIGVTVICEHQDGRPENEKSMGWHVIREVNQWLLDRPE